MANVPLLLFDHTAFQVEDSAHRHQGMGQAKSVVLQTVEKGIFTDLQMSESGEPHLFLSEKNSVEIHSSAEGMFGGYARP